MYKCSWRNEISLILYILLPTFCCTKKGLSAFLYRLESTFGVSTPSVKSHKSIVSVIEGSSRQLEEAVSMATGTRIIMREPWKANGNYSELLTSAELICFVHYWSFTKNPFCSLWSLAREFYSPYKWLVILRVCRSKEERLSKALRFFGVLTSILSKFAMLAFQIYGSHMTWNSFGLFWCLTVKGSHSKTFFFCPFWIK